LVTRLKCGTCDAVVEGEFPPCPVCRLQENDRRLFDVFMAARGNMKDVQRELGLSYPTVRSRMEGMFEQYERLSDARVTPMEVLSRVRSGEITVEEAERLLRGSQS